MIGVNFKGRLGNQLFQFYFLQYLKSQKKGTVFFFPNPHHAYLTKYFDLGWYLNLTLGSKLYSGFTRVLPHILPFKQVFIENFYRPRPRPIDNFTIYNGYFQSDYYIRNTPDPIKLKIKQPFVDKFRATYGELFDNNKTLVVHIRRTDYLNYGKRDISLPMAYFQQRLDAIENLGQYKVIFVSDDIKHAQAVFGERENFIYSANDEITDFQVIMNADVAIISNSSFAWWAAYISPKNNMVYAPKNWMGFRVGGEHPKGVMTDRFIWCEANI